MRNFEGGCGPSDVSGAKTAEPIQMQFGMLDRMGPENHVLDRGAKDPTGRGVWPIVKHCKAYILLSNLQNPGLAYRPEFWRLDKRVICAKSG